MSIEDFLRETEMINWYSVGVALDIPIDDLIYIGETYSDATNAKIHLYKKWLEHDGRGSWSEFFLALNMIGHKNSDLYLPKSSGLGKL